MAKSSEEKHTTVGGIAGIIYQYYVFLYNLLAIKPGEVVSFEKLDDAAIETPSYIALFQAKHTVKCGVDGESVPLTNRAQDFWKAIDIWLDLIKKDGKQDRTKDEQLKYIDTHKFHFVSNKAPYDNGFYQLCQKDGIEQNLTAIDAVLDFITAEGRSTETKVGHDFYKKYRSVQNIIDDLKAFELRKEFISQIRFETASLESLKTKCYAHLTDTVRFDEEDARKVFDDFKIEVEKDLFNTLAKGEHLEYTFEFQKRRFQRVFQFHRVEDLNFRIMKEKFRPEFLNLICIKQLLKVDDLKPTDTDRVAEKTSHYLSFKNRFQELHDNYKILVPEEEQFNEEIMTIWGDEFKYVYKDTNEETPDSIIIGKANDLLRDVRKNDLTLCKQKLGIPVSNGAFYYFSDECKIGWHRDWKMFFGKKEEDGQNRK